jgi:hypothetical protein
MSALPPSDYGYQVGYSTGFFKPGGYFDIPWCTGYFQFEAGGNQYTAIRCYFLTVYGDKRPKTQQVITSNSTRTA